MGSPEIDNVSVIGPTTNSGQPAVERDTTAYYNGLAGGVGTVTKDFLGATSAGLVDYNQTNSNYGSTDGSLTIYSSHLYETAEVIIPATLEVGQPVTVNSVDTFTTTNYTQNDQINTITRDISNTGTLVSDTPQPLTVPAGTFSCYQVQQTLLWTQSSGTTTINETVYLATGVGIVEIDETDSTDSGGSGSSIKQLSSFTGADRLVFNPPAIANTQAGDPIQPAITVSVQDSTGDVISDAGGTVTLTPAGVNAANPITGNTATLVNGVATFSDLVLTKAGAYQLQATDTNGDAMGTSNKFGITGDKLTSSVQPKNTDPAEPLTVKVTAFTRQGKPDTKLNDTLQLGLNVISGGVDATLAGITTLSLKGGSATFSRTQAVAVDVPGTYSLSATALSDGSADFTVTTATSNPFSVAGYHLVFNSLPTTVAFAPVSVKVSLENAHGKVNKLESSAQVQLSLNTVTDGEGAVLQGTTIATFNQGVAIFSASAAPAIAGGGTFTLTATEIGTDNPAPVEVSKSFIVQPLELRAENLPSNGKQFLALRGLQLVGPGISKSVDLSLFAPGKKLSPGQISLTQLPNLQFTVIPAGNGAAVDHSQDQFIPKYEVTPDSSATDLAFYTTFGVIVPFATPGTYRLQFEPAAGAVNNEDSGGTTFNNADAPLSAIKPYTTTLLKVVDPVIVAQSSPRVMEAGDTFTVNAHLWFPNDPGNLKAYIAVQPGAGLLFTLTGTFTSAPFTSVTTYHGQLNYGSDTTLNIPFSRAGKYTLTLRATYTPGPAGTPFDPLTSLPADGLDIVSIPIMVKLGP